MYSWNLDRDSSDGSRPDFFLEPVEENIRNASFIAPYVRFDPSRPDNQTHLSLIFKLVVKDINSRLESDPSWVTIIVKTIQRVLILQGGGALGAYEVGAYRALCERLSAKDKENDARKNRPLFDIIAGTSIGALNAALIVNSIKQSMKAKSPKVPINEMWSKSVVDLKVLGCHNIFNPTF